MIIIIKLVVVVVLSWWAETVSGLPFEFRSLSAVSTESVRAEQADMCLSCTNECMHTYMGL